MRGYRKVLHAIILLFHILCLLFISIDYFSKEDIEAIQPNDEIIINLKENNIIKYEKEDNHVEITIEVVEDNIEKVIERETKNYYKIVYDHFNQTNIEEAHMNVVQKNGKPILNFHYTRERFVQIERDMTQIFFLKHIEQKATDVLNNANNYYIDEEIWKKLSDEVKKNLNEKRKRN